MGAAPPTEPLTERRKRHRFPVRLALDIYYGTGVPLEGMMRDASEMGIAFFCNSPIPAGSPIEFNVRVPGQIAEREQVVVRGRGMVVRSEQQTLGRFLIAAVTEGDNFTELPQT